MSIGPPAHPAPPTAPELPAGIESRATATWSPLTATVGGVGIFFGAAIAAIIPVLIGVALGDSSSNPGPATSFFSILVQDGAIVVGVWLVVGSSGSRRIADALGYRATRVLQAIGWMLLVYVVYFVLSAIWTSLVHDPEQKILQDTGAGDSVLAGIAIAFSVCVVAPLAEETLFRGFIFGGLKRLGGFWPAALISGGLFGAAHVLGSPVQSVLPLAIFGVGLATLYQLTDSIVPGIYLHCLNNCLAFSVGLHLHWETTLVFIGSLASISLALMTIRRMA